MRSRIIFIAGVLCGLSIGLLLRGTPSHAQVSSVPQVHVDETKMTTSYANAFRVGTTAEEAVIDLGFNMPNPAAANPQNDMLFTISNRIIMTYSNTKKLKNAPDTVVRQYEERTHPGANPSTP